MIMRSNPEVHNTSGLFGELCQKSARPWTKRYVQSSNWLKTFPKRHPCRMSGVFNPKEHKFVIGGEESKYPPKAYYYAHIGYWELDYSTTFLSMFGNAIYYGVPKLCDSNATSLREKGDNVSKTNFFSSFAESFKNFFNGVKYWLWILSKV